MLSKWCIIRISIIRGDRMADIKNKKIQITISPKTLEQLEKLAEEKQLTKSVIIQLAVEQYFQKECEKENNK